MKKGTPTRYALNPPYLRITPLSAHPTIMDVQTWIIPHEAPSAYPPTWKGHQIKFLCIIIRNAVNAPPIPMKSTAFWSGSPGYCSHDVNMLNVSGQFQRYSRCPRGQYVSWQQSGQSHLFKTIFKYLQRFRIYAPQTVGNAELGSLLLTHHCFHSSARSIQ